MSESLPSSAKLSKQLFRKYLFTICPENIEECPSALPVSPKFKNSFSESHFIKKSQEQKEWSEHMPTRPKAHHVSWRQSAITATTITLSTITRPILDHLGRSELQNYFCEHDWSSRSFSLLVKLTVLASWHDFRRKFDKLATMGVAMIWTAVTKPISHQFAQFKGQFLFIVCNREWWLSDCRNKGRCWADNAVAPEVKCCSETCGVAAMPCSSCCFCTVLVAWWYELLDWDLVHAQKARVYS